jgi:hypothetical protein
MSNPLALMIPPRKRRQTPGRWRLPADIRVACEEPQDRLGAEKTAALLRQMGHRVRLTAGDAAEIQIRRNMGVSHAEGYRLTVNPAGVHIAARTAAGAFYGLATLRELLRLHGAALPCCRIEDEPFFARRGVYHDCSRGKVPRLSTLKELVDRLAEWKINELQLYIENTFRFARHPAVWAGQSPLTPAEISSLQEYCRGRHIRLVGSLASFGHMEHILALEAYAHLAELPHGSTLCPLLPESLALVAELFAEFVPLFEARDFNICGDETVDLGAGRSAKTCRRRGTGRVYLEFLLKLDRLCRRHAKRTNAWADIVLKHPELLKELPHDLVMLHWGYEAGGKQVGQTRAIAESGLPFVMCPGTSTWQTLGGRWPNARQNIREFAQAGKQLGAEGLLNTDWGDYGHRQFLAISLLPLAFGAAESWNPGAADGAAFPRSFAAAFFGERSGRLARAIEALGQAYLRHGIIQSNRDPLYHNIAERLGGQEVYPTWRTIDRITPEGQAALLDSLPAPATWRQPADGSFEALALEEYAASGRLIELYCRRAAAGWKLGLGQPVPKAELLALADQTDDMAGEFARLWHARNKPSRLADNLRLFRRAAAQARHLARGRSR